MISADIYPPSPKGKGYFPIYSIHPGKKEKKEVLDENENKLEDARAAYEAWLESVEAREVEEAGREEARQRLLIWKPPWYPGGKALYFA
jgi:hypothetical protein